MTSIFVNGRFLGRPVTGVERFASMILRQVDEQLGNPASSRAQWIILAPKGVERPNWWRQGFEAIGSAQGHAWEQWNLAWHAREGVLVNLCNSGPVTLRRSLTIIHDALPYDMPGNFRASYRLLHQNLGRLIARRSTIATVSEFSRNRLAEKLNLPPKRIAVIPNAADHMNSLTEDRQILADLNLSGRRFFLFVGSLAPNKDIATALAGYSRLNRNDIPFVIVGASGKSFAASGLPESVPGVLLPGRLNDEALVTLYRSAHALIFPSIYEGFGIPPLEAMQSGCNVIASDIASSREVCGDAAQYFPPGDIAALSTRMQEALDMPDWRTVNASMLRNRAALFSWERSAGTLREHVNALL